MQRFLLHKYKSIPEIYTILLLRNSKTKKDCHQHARPQTKKITSLLKTKILINYKNIKSTPVLRPFSYSHMDNFPIIADNEPCVKINQDSPGTCRITQFYTSDNKTFSSMTHM